MARKKTDEQKAVYREILNSGQSRGGSAPAGKAQAARRPRRTLGDHLLTVLIVVLAAVALLLGVLLFRAEVLGKAPGSLLGGKTGQGQYLGDTAGVLDETVFIGDSNTVRLQASGLVEPQQVLARSSIGIQAVTDMAFVELEGHSQPMTVVQAVGQMKPRYLVMTLGTNDIANRSVEDFIDRYGQAIDALLAASPGSTVVVNTIPPVCAVSSYTKLSREEVGRFNQALREMCTARGLAFLDSCTAMSNAEGHLLEHYADGDGVHLTVEALTALIDCYTAQAAA